MTDAPESSRTDDDLLDALEAERAYPPAQRAAESLRPGAFGHDARPSVGARATGAAGDGGEPRGEVAGDPWRVALLVGLVAALGIFAGASWVLVIGALVAMIFLHELGHFLTAKWSGMKVTEFFLFFGPKLWSFRRGETEYGVKLLPLGAYVRIIGMNNLDEVAPEDEPRTYRQQSFPKRLLVVSAGSLMHFLQAMVLFFVVFSLVGVPAESPLAQRLGASAVDQADWVVGDVLAGSGAEAAGVQLGDRILSVAGQPVELLEDVGVAVADRVGEEVPIVVERDGQVVELDVTIGARQDDSERGFLGVGQGFQHLPAYTSSPLQSLGSAVTVTGDVIRGTVTSLAGFFTGGVGDFASDVMAGGSASTPDQSSGGGPRPASEEDRNRLTSIFGIARAGAEASETSVVDFLLLLAFVNVGIGVLNMVPLLPLDGGHVAIAVYERIRSIGGRRYMADVSRLMPVAYATLVFLTLLGVSAIYLDIVDPIGLS